MQAALYTGAFDSGTSFNFLCESGNCTWPTFASLGLCSSCENVTSQTHVHQVWTADEAIGIAVFDTPGGWNINLTMINMGGSGTGDQYTAVKGESSFVDVTKNVTNHLVSLVIAQQYAPNGPTMSLQGWETTECSIDWCAKQYSNITVVSNFCFRPILQGGQCPNQRTNVH